MTETSEFLIDFQGVGVSYPLGGGARHVVLKDIHLPIRRGELASLVGPSGCGKTTLLRMVLGAQFPTEGQVLLESERIHGVGRDRGIVFQRYSLFPHVSVLENIAIGPILETTTLPQRIWHRLLYSRSYARARKVHEAEAMEYLKRIGLDEIDARKYPYELSGGMQQRVAIAQALIMKPKVILMDEPFGALDHNTRQEMQLFLLEQWKAHKMTVIFVTHDLEEALFVGTRVIGLSQFWTNDDCTPGQGARIVTDIATPGGHPKPTKFLYSKEFNAMLAALRNQVLNPENRQRVSQFDLSHHDAWHENKAVTNGGAHA